MTEGSSVRRLVTVARETAVSLLTATLVLAERAVAAAVARASRSDPRGDLCPLLQIQSDAVQLQRADAAQKAFLSGRSAPWNTNKLKWYTSTHTLSVSCTRFDGH